MSLSRIFCTEIFIIFLSETCGRTDETLIQTPCFLQIHGWLPAVPVRYEAHASTCLSRAETRRRDVAGFV